MGGIFPFISSPSTLKWAPSCPWGAHTWSPAFSLQSSSHSPHLSPTASFPTSPLPLQSRPSLAKAQAGQPLIQTSGPEGRTACLTWAARSRLPTAPESHTHGAIVPASLGAEAAGGGALLPHRLMRPSQWEAAPLASPIGSSPGRVTPSHIQFLTSCSQGEDGVFDES